jgi:hypothetical protein
MKSIEHHGVQVAARSLQEEIVYHFFIFLRKFFTMVVLLCSRPLEHPSLSTIERTSSLHGTGTQHGRFATSDYSSFFFTTVTRS